MHEYITNNYSDITAKMSKYWRKCFDILNTNIHKRERERGESKLKFTVSHDVCFLEEQKNVAWHVETGKRTSLNALWGDIVASVVMAFCYFTDGLETMNWWNRLSTWLSKCQLDIFVIDEECEY